MLNYEPKDSSKNWRDFGREYTRNRARIRDKFTCQSCGKKRTLEMARRQGKRLFDIHHLNGLCGKKSRAYDRIKDLDSLITLCHKCHYNRHDRSEKIGARVKNKKRDLKIKSQRRRGQTLREIAKTFKISRERVRQIVTP